MGKHGDAFKNNSPIGVALENISRTIILVDSCIIYGTLLACDAARSTVLFAEIFFAFGQAEGSGHGGVFTKTNRRN